MAQLHRAHEPRYTPQAWGDPLSSQVTVQGLVLALDQESLHPEWEPCSLQGSGLLQSRVLPCSPGGRPWVGQPEDFLHIPHTQLVSVISQP